MQWNNVTQGEWLLYVLQKIVMENDVLFMSFNWVIIIFFWLLACNIYAFFQEMEKYATENEGMTDLNNSSSS
jgi:hypothetical protein